MHPVADGGDGSVRREDAEPVGDAAVADPNGGQPDDQWIGELQLGEVPARRLDDEADGGERSDVDTGCLGSTSQLVLIHALIAVSNSS